MNFQFPLGVIILSAFEVIQDLIFFLFFLVTTHLLFISVFRSTSKRVEIHYISNEERFGVDGEGFGSKLK